MASWLVRSSPDRAVLVRALARDLVLCSWARHILTVPLSTQVYKCWGQPCDGPASHPVGRRNTLSRFMLNMETGINSGLMGHLARMQTLPTYSAVTSVTGYGP